MSRSERRFFRYASDGWTLHWWVHRRDLPDKFVWLSPKQLENMPNNMPTHLCSVCLVNHPEYVDRGFKLRWEWKS